MTTVDIDPTIIVSSTIIEPRGALSFRMWPGQVCRVVDLEGKQVADLVCMSPHDPLEKLSVENTQLINGTIYISEGHHLYSSKSAPLMTIIKDTCGVHDLISGSCSAETNAFRYGVRGTPNCRSNFARVLRDEGIPLREIPYSFNIFMNVPVGDGGATGIREPKSTPGDFVDLKANTELIVAVSNCPQERNPCNGWVPTALQIIVFDPGAAGSSDTLANALS